MKPTHFLLVAILTLSLSSQLAGQAGASEGCARARQLIEQGATLKKTKQKMEQFRQALALCPEADGPHYYYGLALEEKEDSKKNGNYQVAEAAYRKALAINPGHYPALYRLAGIEYITGRFDSAFWHYSRYLKLDRPNEENQATRQAAKSLFIKSGWLMRLPKGSVKAGALVRDPDRFAGLPWLAGDIAFELGQSAMNVTGQAGYGLAGAGVKLGVALLSGAGNLGYRKAGKAFREDDYATAYRLALEQLPKAVNDYGINSELVFHLLRVITVSGSQLALNPGGLILDLDKGQLAFPPEVSLEDIAPFISGFILAAETYQVLEPEPGTKGEMYTYFWDVATAIRDHGHLLMRQGDHLGARAAYQEGRRHIETHGGLFVNGKRILSDEDLKLRKLDLALQAHIANAEAMIDSTHSMALQSLLDTYEAIQVTITLWGDEGLSYVILDAIIKWVKADNSPAFQQQRTLADRRKLHQFSASPRLQKANSRQQALLEEQLFYSHLAWGEYGRAFQSLRRIRPAEEEKAEKALKLASLFNASLMPDSALLYLEAADEARQILIPAYREKLRAVQLLLLQDRYEEALQHLVACKQVEARKHTLSAATGLWWALVASKTAEGTALLDELQLRWAQAAEEDWAAFIKDGKFLLRALAFSDAHALQAKQLFGYLLSVAMANSRCTQEDQDEFRLAYFLATRQTEKAMALCEEALSLSGAGAQDSAQASFRFLENERLALAALLRQQTGDYARAANLSRILLSRLQPYGGILPENTAYAKARLAKSLATLGDKEEALRLLEEAEAALGPLYQGRETVRKEPVRAALQQLKEGKKDIGILDKFELFFE